MPIKTNRPGLHAQLGAVHGLTIGVCAIILLQFLLRPQS